MIAVESEPGEGTVFRIGFPRLEGTAEPAAEEPTGADSDEGQTGLEGTETVLVVDDDDTVRQLVHRMLASHGYTVLAAKRAR